jgi:ferredoxin-NADP reductase
MGGATYVLYPSEPEEPTVLHSKRFQPFAIVTKERVSSTSQIYTLQPRHDTTTDPYADIWQRGIWSVEFKQPQLQISRAYTPLPPLPNQPPGNLRFLIRKEHKGEVSNYLDRLYVGAFIDVRGPKVEFELEEGVEEVLFVAGGTGIAPALQVAHTLLDRRKHAESPRINILWANRRREDCAGAPQLAKKAWWPWSKPAPEALAEAPNKIVEELQDLEERHQGNFHVDYMVDEEGTFVDRKMISNALQKKSGKPAQGAKLIIISGPDGFVANIAGPKDISGDQGPLGGMLSRLQLGDWKVVKL